MNRRFEYAVTDTANYSALVAHAGEQTNDLMIGQMSMSRQALPRRPIIGQTGSESGWSCVHR